jgi:PDZ domain-containing protein
VARLSLVPIEKIPGGAAVAGLSRRVRTLIVAGVLFLVLFILAVTMPVPYVVLSPGPTINTLGTDGRGNSIIGIDGRKPAQRKGHLNLTTVSVSGRSITAFEALSGWLAGDQVVVPTSSVYPPGESEQQTNQQNAQDFTDSQDNATVAAACELGYPKKFGIIGVRSDGAGHAVLQPADILTTIDSQPTATADSLAKVLSAKAPGTKVQVALTRAGVTKVVTVALGPPVPGRKGGSLGVTVGSVCATPYKVDLGLGNEIGGPSAGLMFALGIMDKVGPTDLTKGRFIAGTGTIDTQGKVGPIGGIALKMIAARDKGATVFLAPAGNCGDVTKATPSGLKVVKVSTLHGAVQDLVKIEKGQSVPGC